MKTFIEEIKRCVEGDAGWHNTFNTDAASYDRIIALAYRLGYRDCMNEAKAEFDEIAKVQHDRAQSCRYHNLAESVIGNEKLYFIDGNIEPDLTDALNDIIPEEQ